MAKHQIKGAHPIAHHPRQGIKDWVDLIFKDHGFLRLGWHNLHEIGSGVFRQTSLHQKTLKDMQKLWGLRPFSTYAAQDKSERGALKKKPVIMLG